MLADPAFWTSAAFIVFVLAVGRIAWRTATQALDARAAKIGAELDEAQKLREEAQHLLAEFQRKQRDAVKEAEAILDHARDEVKRMGEKASQDLKAAIARRERRAKDRIAQTEAQALAEVRAAAVELAIGAAGKIMAEKLDAKKSSALIDRAIDELPGKLH